MHWCARKPPYSVTNLNKNPLLGSTGPASAFAGGVKCSVFSAQVPLSTSERAHSPWLGAPSGLLPKRSSPLHYHRSVSNTLRSCGCHCSNMTARCVANGSTFDGRSFHLAILIRPGDWLNVLLGVNNAAPLLQGHHRSCITFTGWSALVIIDLRPPGGNML